MAVARSRIGEHDYVALAEPLGRWPKGTRGTALVDHGESKLVEIADDQGVMLDLLEVPEAKLDLIVKYS